MAAGLEAVDAVTFFDEDTPRELIAAVLPDILIKGADWAHFIAGREEVEAAGGQVMALTARTRLLHHRHRGRDSAPAEHSFDAPRNSRTVPEPGPRNPVSGTGAPDPTRTRRRRSPFRAYHHRQGALPGAALATTERPLLVMVDGNKQAEVAERRRSGPFRSAGRRTSRAAAALAGV